MFESQTLFVSSLVSRGAILVVLLAAVISQPHLRHMWHWIAALLFSILGLTLLLVASENTAVFFYRFASLMTIMSSMVFSWGGLRLFYHRPLHRRRMLLLTTAPPMLYALLVALQVPERFALVPPLLGAAIFCLLCIREILTAPDKRLLTQYVMGVAFALYLMGFVAPAVLLPFGLISSDILSVSHTSMLLDQVGCIIVYFSYITANSEYTSQQLKQLAETDALTGLLNRRGIWQAMKSLGRSAAQQPYSVLIADIDHFKSINDRGGHKAGDRVLTVFVERMRHAIGKNGIAARWGGEEFLILLPGTAATEAGKVAERLRHEVAATPCKTPGMVFEVTVSIGVAESRPDDSDNEAAIKRADRALYSAKSEGRNRVCEYNAGMSLPFPAA
ncbi:GGDEF domain-containing protein [Kushneria aurantia]|uniref:diguanylate cyclase n=1 Tax=Kushneria aurantia TaxID=504092 RepID=A0ABV6G0Z6_9GAMM|nr:GGDEF domain-containing protein [Kushneria aurantia]